MVTPQPQGSVDLGLSVFWAEKNLGASGVLELGDTYHWGDITPESSSTRWETTDGNYTKYNEEDNLLLLAPEDDAAAVALGGRWRMPTTADAQELLDNCTLTTRPIGENLYAFRFTSKKNGNYIEFPIKYVDGAINENDRALKFWLKDKPVKSANWAWARRGNCLELSFGQENCRCFYALRTSGLHIRPVSD